MSPYVSAWRAISRSKNPFFSRFAPARAAYSAGVQTLALFPPVVHGLVGTRRAPGRNNDRNRPQSRFWPAGPEMTAYTSVMIASSVATSAGFAAGAGLL